MSKTDEIERRLKQSLNTAYNNVSPARVKHERSIDLLVRAVRQLGAFRRYAQHKVGCEVWAGAACDCGLSKLLEEGSDDVLELIGEQDQT